MNNVIPETPTISRARFRPTHVELVNILRKRIDRGERSSLITDNHILYETAPWLVEHVRHVSFYENEWYYFVTRKQPLVVTRKADSWRLCRKVGGLGRWKTSGLTKVIDKKGVRVGSMHYASFLTNGETQKDGKKTGWTMLEFLLDRPDFQELVLCRIRFNPGKDNAQYAPRFTSIVIGQPPVETHQDPDTEHQGIMEQDLNNLLLNEGMNQNQNLGSYGQQQENILGHMEQYGQGFGDLVENQIQYLVQETMDRLQVPMMMNQALNEEQEWNEYSGEAVLPDQDSSYPIWNGGMEQHQNFGSYVQQQQDHILGQMGQYGQSFGDMVEYQNQYLGQDKTDGRNVPVMMNQALNEEKQWNKYSGPSLAQQYFGQDMDPMTQHLAAQHQDLSVDDTLPTIPMTTQQQQDNTVINLAAQQDNVPLMNQAAYLPINQGIDEPHGDIVGYL